MLTMRPLFLLFALFLAALQLSFAHDADRHEKIWGAFVYTLHGDNTPHTSFESRTLTPLGAYQLFGAGYAIRDLYITTSSFNATEFSHQVSGISEYNLVNDEIDILSTTDQFVSASAQAFMQGLYPPMGETYGSIVYDSSQSVNGTMIDYPLDGYQYSNVITAGPGDPASIYVAGHASCPSYSKLQLHYFGTPYVHNVIEETAPFYADLCARMLCAVLPSESVNYRNAQYISDYLQYEYIHNSTARNMLLPQDLDHARYLADQLVFAQNGYVEPEGSKDGKVNLNAYAGKTLAYYVVEALENNIHTQGATNKMTLLFGSVEPMVAFQSLLRLPSENQPNFYGRPNHGASLVIELFSWESDPMAPYPSHDTEFMVRFLLRNSTDAWDLSTPFIPYPMFGFSPSQTVMRYKEFLSYLIDDMVGVSSWCTTCSSSSVFCSAYTSGRDPYRDSPGSPRGMKPISAGVIGFFVGICALGIFIALLPCCGAKRLLDVLCFGYRGKGRRSSRTNSQTTWPMSPGAQSSTVCDDRSESVELSNRPKSNSSNGAPDAYLANPTRESDGESLTSPAIQPVKVREVV